MCAELHVELLGEETIEEQLQVYKTAFNTSSDYNVLKKRWYYKHYSNPVHESFVFGAYDGNFLVSINAYMPMRYQIDNRIVNLIQSCESGTLPDYRGKGVWSKVVKYAVNYFKESGKYDFLIGFPNYENSFGGFMKMDWNYDLDLINYVLISNGDCFSKLLFGRKMFFSQAFELPQIRLRESLMDNYLISAKDKQIKNDKSEAFDVELSKEFIEWKKEYKELKSFCIKSNVNDSIAVCLYEIDNYKGAKIAVLDRIIPLDDKGNYREIYSVALQEIMNRNNDLAFIRTWVIRGSETEKIVKSLWFLESKHKNPFITYQLKEDVVTEKELRDKMKWKNLSFLDLD